MKKILYILKTFVCLFCILSAQTGFAQNVGISSTSSFTPDASAGLDVSYTNKGLLMPRVTLTATNTAGPITSPAISLLVYNTATAGTAPNNVVPGYYYWNGVAWTALSTGAQSTNSAWSTTGNTGTTAGTNFIGTTDAVDFVFKTNSIERARVNSTGNFGIGSTAFNSTNPEQLLVDAGASSFNVISGKGNLNNYLQLNIQNINAGTSASSDVVATADNGSETANYVDMGVNSSANTAAFFGAANDAYLYNAGGSVGGNFFIGTSTAGKSLGFLTGGGATSNERMRIDGNGNVGIGSTSPTQKLDVAGSINAYGTVYVDGANSNTGTRIPGVNFGGASSAEGISSKRTSGNNQFGLDFYTLNLNRMAITNAGNVGIGNITPTEKLDISGNLKFSGALMPNNNPGTNGYFLVSQGAGVAPIWYNATAYINTAAWVLSGNAGTNPGTQFIGTTDAKDFVFKTNNTEAGRFTSTGSFGIGSASFNATNPEKLLVDAGASSFNVISGKGNLNNYLQLNIQNTNAGTAASSDVVATADNGNESTNYVDMGINSSTNTAAFFGAANDAYLYNTGGTVGGNFFIGTSTTGKSLGFLTGGGAATNERMHIDGSGNVGIGTTAPATKLHVFGANPLTLSGVVTGTNTSADSLLTITNGLVRKLPMATFASTANAWSITGNAGTTAGTNFLGTTDANDLVFKANNTERLRIVNGVSSATGTAGDVTIGDATSGTLRSAKELLLRQDGDLYGPSALHLRNRGGENGAIFETIGASANLVDFIFRTGTASSPISSNIRFETRSGSMKVTGNTTEWQFGQPDVVNGGPTLVVGAAGTGSNSAIRTGNFGIGTTNPATKLHVFGANPLTLSGVVTGTSTTADSLLTITSGLVRKLPISTFITASNTWSTAGNTGTTAGTNFIGTTDAVDFVLKTNSVERARFSSTGNVSIGGTAFNASNPEKLLVDAGTTSSTNVISGKGTINSFLQLNIQNLSTGLNASSDVVATADNGTDAANYVDMGINGSGNKNGFYFGLANDAYLYNAGGSVGGDFYIGNSTSGKVLAFLTGGATASNERMRIDGSGNVGIGTTTPGYKLTIAGIVAPSADNTYSLGGGTTNRWTAVYATNGTIQTSDRRLKTNIKPLNYGLKEVLAMQPVSYNWKEKPTTEHKIGLIAQDIRKVVPEVVTGNEAKEKLGMNYAELVPVLINAIKEQQNTLNKQQKEIDDLKKAIQKLQK